VDAVYADWASRGLRILQTPVEMDFGYTFVATDPDGHRLRVYAGTNQG
jgi:predicted enzyme related to lactoylglutathione lyase